MTSYFITGGSGFIGRRVIDRLLTVDPDATIHALVRESSRSAFAALLDDLGATERVTPGRRRPDQSGPRSRRE